MSNRIRRVLVLLSAILFICQSATAEDWPTYAHDNQRSGVTSDQLSLPLHLKWTFESAAPPAKGWSPPVNGYGARKNKSNVSYDDAFRAISVGGVIYFCSSAENCVYAIDAKTGLIRWTFFTDAAPRLAPTHSDGKLFFGADDGTVYCLQAGDGKLVWSFDAALTAEKMLGYRRFSSVWPIRTSVLIEDDIAHFVAGLFSSEGTFFYALNIADGSLVWRREIDESAQGYLLSSNDSIFMTSRVAPTRWSKKDGSRNRFVTPFPNVNKSHEYRFHNGGTDARVWNGKNIVYGEACLLAYDPNTEFIDKYKRTQKGKLIFNWFNAREIVFHNDLAYVATDYHVLAVKQSILSDLANGECRAIEELYKACRVSSRLDTVEKYERLVRQRGEDHPQAVSLKNGPMKWSQPGWDRWEKESPQVFEKLTERCRWSKSLTATEAMIKTGDRLVLGGEKAVYVIDAKTGEIVWTAETDSRVRGLCVADGSLIVSTIDGSVRCYGSGASRSEPVRIAKVDAEKLPFPADGLTDFYSEIAEHVLEGSDWQEGYCAVLGGGDGRLAYELAKRTGLTVCVLDDRLDVIDKARTQLASAGLYGSRITIEEADLRKLPFPPYVFNLVIDQNSLSGGASPTPASEIVRLTRPLGGVAFIRQPKGRAPEQPNVEVKTRGSMLEIKRGALPGAKDWTHNYATAANTYCSEDQRVKGPFGVLWYGEPGPQKRVDRHATAPIPLVAGGIMFTEGYDLLMAYDIYNGVQYWEREIPGVTRTSLPLGTSNIAADADGLFVVVNNRECWRLNAKTGETLQRYPTPTREGAEINYWGWIAKQGSTLYGSRSLPDPRRRQPDLKHSDEIFAIDINSGKTRWRYTAESIEHDGIAVSDGRVVLAHGGLTDEEKATARNAIPKDKSVPDRKAVDRRGNPIEPDLRKLVALDATSGRMIWEFPFDATDITLDDNVVHDARVAVACMVKDNVVVVHGTGSLGHPHREFLGGEFSRRAIFAFNVKNGKYLWGGRKNYRKRPIIVGDYIYAEPYAWRLDNGEPKQVENPLTGEMQDFDLHRGYIGCSHLLASGAALFGNKDGIGYCNLDSREGFSSFRDLALGCGIVATPAGGVFVAPEGRSGCTCASPIHTSLALYPRRQARSWGRSSVGGLHEVITTPVKHAFVNLGAPGFREDAEKRLWLPYPAKGGAGLVGKWLPTYRHDASMFYSFPEELSPVSDTPRPWLFTSGYQHTKELRFRFIDKGQPEAHYTVKLYFAEPDDRVEEQRVFSVSLQGEVVLKDFDIVKQAGGARRAITKTFKNVKVTGDLIIGFQSSQTTKGRSPVLCAFEAVREDR